MPFSPFSKRVTLGAEHDTPLTFGEVSLELGS